MIAPGDDHRPTPGYWAHYRPKARTQRVTETLLGREDGDIRCPMIIRLGFALKPDEDPLELLRRLLAEEGYRDPEDLRDALEIPDRPYICRFNTGAAPSALDAPAAEVLWQGVMLGLCTAQFYDPRRPVIWTRTSLGRVLDLFDPEGFYA